MPRKKHCPRCGSRKVSQSGQGPDGRSVSGKEWKCKACGYTGPLKSKDKRSRKERRAWDT